MKVHILHFIKASLHPFLLSIMAFFMPIVPLIFLVGMFILGDTIVGIWAAIKRSEKITSRKLGNVVPKMLLYQGAIIFGYMMDVWLLAEFTNYIFSVDMLITKLIAMTLIFIESLSLIENIESITGKNIFQRFKQMITRAAKIKEHIKDLE